MKSSDPYHSRRHSAARTDDYLYSQLIPYLGNKRKLIPLIAAAVASTGAVQGVFADLFAGSGVVSRWAKRQGYQVVANDWEPYTEAINGCYVGLNEPPDGAAELLETLNALPPAPHGYITDNYCPVDDENPDPDHERCFFTHANGARIDAIRQTIADWSEHGQLTPEAHAYLIAPLLYAASYVSNTSGIFKAYHRGWGGSTGDALYRIMSVLRVPTPVLRHSAESHRVTCMDAGRLAKNWGALVDRPMTIAYLDPPYNQHPYGSNYHLLNTLALWDKPEVGPVARGTKSAIRQDWRMERRSLFNHKDTALNALTNLVEALPARWVLISYSTHGNIPADTMLEAMAERGAATLLPRRYNRYRVSTPRMPVAPHTVEFVLTIDRDAPADRRAVDVMRGQLAEAATA
ncbi:restriction endonuclease subunit M [Capsulimonas corticalis]|uniref:site-specific DNA-methyltransferase (adenine-specific) n=1 Tax=Capsulimonas corticalis TaxID=2219043 RepID=A0A402D2Q9_9BACT|nr:DNA adenine methylase [Capsulimonas corticalis]BDI29923.1 restriction endonuclease subunit M [Capsulimonas corticalis]